MKEARVYAGNPVTVQIRETSVPTPGPDQVLIKVHVSGTNPKDWKVYLLPSAMSCCAPLVLLARSDIKLLVFTLGCVDG